MTTHAYSSDHKPATYTRRKHVPVKWKPSKRILSTAIQEKFTCSILSPLLGRCWDVVERWEILRKQFHLESGWYPRGKSSARLLQIVISATGVGGAGKRFLLPSKPGLNKLNVLPIRCLKWIFSLNASDSRFMFNLNIILICIYFLIFRHEKKMDV